MFALRYRRYPIWRENVGWGPESRSERRPTDRTTMNTVGRHSLELACPTQRLRLTVCGACLALADTIHTMYYYLQRMGARADSRGRAAPGQD